MPSARGYWARHDARASGDECSNVGRAGGVTSAPARRILARLFDPAAVRRLFDDFALLQSMLDFEGALAHAEARTGVIPVDAGEAIAAKCRAELFDFESLAEAAGPAGNPAIPMVKQLTNLVRAVDPEAARYVHWGATSQDAMDTGLVLQLRRFLNLLETDLQRLVASLTHLAAAHRL